MSDENAASHLARFEHVVDSLESTVTQSKPDEESQFPNGLSACVCTHGAQTVCQSISRGVVMGYRHDDNPGTVCGEFAGGHDFAVIDGRYIVDYWIKWVACLADRAVFDLVYDADEVRRLYGDKKRWTLVSRPV